MSQFPIRHRSVLDKNEEFAAMVGTTIFRIRVFVQRLSNIEQKSTVPRRTIPNAYGSFEEKAVFRTQEVEMTTITTTSAAAKAPQGISWSFLRKLAIGAGALALAFLLGYIPSSLSSSSAQQQNAELQRKLRVADLGGQLAMASYEANRNNYANATQFSSQFFNGLPAAIVDTKDDALKQKLQAMLGRKDEIASNPAQVDPTMKEKLTQMYAEYFKATQTGKESGQ